MVDMVFGYAPPSHMIDHIVFLIFGLLILYPTLFLKLEMINPCLKKLRCSARWEAATSSLPGEVTICRQAGIRLYDGDSKVISEYMPYYATNETIKARF